MICGFGLSADATARIRRGSVAAPTARARLRVLAAALVLVAFGFAQCGVSAQVVPPQPEASRIQVAAGRENVYGLVQLVRFAVTQRGHTRIRSVRGKIKNKHVVLVILKSGDQRQQFATAGSVTMA